MHSLQSVLVLGTILGSGTYGPVYEARWDHQQCAAKTLCLTQSDLHEQTIQREIEALQKLRHRHIIQFHRTYEQDDTIYLIMELAERGTLAKAITKDGLLDWPTKARIAHEIARGLDYIHQESVLHRDLKSANVLLTGNMEVKLANFGLVKVRSTVNSSTSMSSAVGGLTGNIRWIAPELFDSPVYSTKSDVYAMGVVMWEMAANCTRPYKNQDNEWQISMRVKDGHRETLPDDTPAEYREWVERCWDQDINQRPDASEVILVQEEQEENGDEDDDNAVSISLTFNNDGINLVNKQSKLSIGESHSGTAAAASGGGRLPQMDDEAVRCYHMAAEQGQAAAQSKLGWMYEQGHGVEQSDVDAVKWYTKAAEQGHAAAQSSIGVMYRQGYGVEQSDVEAAMWFTKAAEQGHAAAQSNIGW
ncbi:hypothetical protein BGZ95_003331, partial [Linnemannia exigua]